MAKKRPLINGLPAVFVTRLQEQFPKDAKKLLTFFQQRPPVIRTNSLLTDSQSVREQLNKEEIQTEEIPLLPEAFIVRNADRRRLTDSKMYTEGQFYIQSIASQLAVKALDPQPGEKILDLCAAPGSKTTQIAIAMKKQGELLANDNNKKRMYRLHANLKHQQVDDFVEVKNYSGQNYPKFYPEYFDRILVDAPCSSEARFDPRYPKSINYWSHHKVKSSAKIQRRLLSAAVKCTRPGGSIVYSTCTLSPEENELVISWVLEKHPEVSLQKLDWKTKRLPILKSWGEKQMSEEVQKAIRLFPDENTEAFFICKITKKEISH